jgi:hypothetical protein
MESAIEHRGTRNLGIPGEIGQDFPKRGSYDSGARLLGDFAMMSLTSQSRRELRSVNLYLLQVLDS